MPAHRSSRTDFQRSGLASVAALLVAGCASPGPPRPPTLHIPAPVRDLRADRIGDTVVLHWTSPDTTTDHLPLRPPLVAEICRDDHPRIAPHRPPTAPAPLPPPITRVPSVAPLGASPPVAATPDSPSAVPSDTTAITQAGAPSASVSSPATSPSGAPRSACTPVLSMAVQPGPAIATATLPPGLVTGPATLLGFRIRLQGPTGRFSGLSTPAFAAAGAAPAPVAGFAAISADRGIRLTWQPRPGDGTVEISRRPDATTPHRPSSTPTYNQAPPLERLVPDISAQAPDPGGMIDTSAQRDAGYTYTAARLRRETISGQQLLLSSIASPPIHLRFQDVAPPATPTGLTAILVQTPGQPPSVDLSWEPNSEPDLRGYLVYRSSQGPDGPWLLLTQNPIVPPAFRDHPPETGSYLYRITAIDQTGNPSKPSTPTRP